MTRHFRYIPLIIALISYFFLDISSTVNNSNTEIHQISEEGEVKKAVFPLKIYYQQKIQKNTKLEDINTKKSISKSQELTPSAESFDIQSILDEKLKLNNFEYYVESAEKGNLDNQFLLGAMFFFGKGTKQDFKEAFKWFRKNAKSDDTRGKICIAFMYLEGIGVNKNIEQAIKWLKEADSQESAYAEMCYKIGRLYILGLGVTKNETEAAKWFKLSADKGHAFGQLALGIMYVNGTGVKKDEVEAARLIQLSAKQEVASGQHYLGVMYLTGRGVKKNIDEAARLFHLAANQGVADSQHNLGQMYLRGEGVVQDENEAIKLFKSASEKGNQLSSIMLAVFLPGGEIVNIGKYSTVVNRGKTESLPSTEASKLLAETACKGSEEAKVIVAPFNIVCK